MFCVLLPLLLQFLCFYFDDVKALFSVIDVNCCETHLKCETDTKNILNRITVAHCSTFYYPMAVD